MAQLKVIPNNGKVAASYVIAIFFCTLLDGVDPIASQPVG